MNTPVSEAFCINNRHAGYFRTPYAIFIPIQDVFLELNHGDVVFGKLQPHSVPRELLLVIGADQAWDLEK